MLYGFAAAEQRASRPTPPGAGPDQLRQRLVRLVHAAACRTPGDVWFVLRNVV